MEEPASGTSEHAKGPRPRLHIAWSKHHVVGALGVALAIASFVVGVFVGELKTRQNARPGQINVIDRGAPVSAALKDLDFAQFWQVWQSVHDEYVRQPVPDRKMFYGAISGMVGALGDPYSVYFDPEVAQTFSSELAGKFDGIGAEIGVKKEQLTVIAPLPGTPAERAGIKAGDRILAIDGADTTSMPVDEAVHLIRGVKGTAVKLMIIREGWKEPKEFSIVRDTIVVQSVKLKMVATAAKKKVALITITNFNQDTESGFDQAVRAALLVSPDGIVLDLRNNPGGFLDTAVSVAGEWVSKDVIVVEKYSDGKKDEYKSEGAGRLAGIPTAVLVNGGSASASEIVAGALQDYGKASIIGEQTFGKGSVQDYHEFSDGSALKLTIALWFTPKGRSIDKQGITPDSKVKMTDADFENDRDPQLDEALRTLFAPKAAVTPAP